MYSNGPVRACELKFLNDRGLIKVDFVLETGQEEVELHDLQSAVEENAVALRMRAYLTRLTDITGNICDQT